MNIFLPTKISRFLILVITTFLVVAFTILGSITYYGFVQNEKQRFQQEVELILSIAEKTFTQSLWTFDSQLAQSTAQAFLNNGSTIVKVEIYDSKDILFATSKSPQTTRPQTELQSVKRRIVFEDQYIGSVQLYYLSTETTKFSEKLRRSIFFIFSLVTINLIILVTITLRYTLGSPLSGLMQIAKSLREGKRNFEKPNWGFEFKEIGNALWLANKTILERDQLLEDNNSDLEKLVQTRNHELDEQKNQMISKNRLASLGEFSAGIAHEINNPLSVISGRAALVRHRLEKGADPRQSLDDLDKIANMVTRISKIINGLRNFARDGENEPIQTFKALKFFDDIKDMSSYKMQNRGIHFSIEISDPDLEITAREVQLSQVLINLVNNSIDAIGDLNDRWISIKAWQDREYTYLKISDSGQGIKPELRDKIFQPFFTTKETGKGTGIGLSISIGIIKEIGGELTYDDSETYTTFLIKLKNTPSL